MRRHSRNLFNLTIKRSSTWQPSGFSLFGASKSASRPVASQILMRPVRIGLFCLALLGTMAWPVQASTATVKVRDSYYTPDFRVIVTGDRVVWQVEGSEGHTVSSYPGDPVVFDSSPGTVDSCEPTSTGGGLIGGGSQVVPDCLRQGDTYDQTFEDPGTIDFYCKVHGNPAKRPKPEKPSSSQPCGMCARILVKVPSTIAPATRHPTPEPHNNTNPSASASPSPSVSPTVSGSPEPGTSLVAGESDGSTGGSGGLRALFATGAIALLTGLGVVVWRRYFVTE
jgi:plastocyanin